MEPLHTHGNLNLVVSRTPLGGYRGEIGTLSVNYHSGLPFTSWDKEDLKNLAQLTQKVLRIHENHQIHNTLIYGKQNSNGFTVEFVPYPKCDWKEKIQGAFHAVFGGASLSDNELDAITAFYQSQNDFSEAEETESEEGEDFSELKPLVDKPDPFCRPEVINRQQVESRETLRGNYDILCDNCPKGASQSDPHILIVPEGATGHIDGSEVSIEMRTEMLQMVQQAMQVFLEEGYTTLLYLERNGEKLQGVKHKHSHAIGIEKFPETFCAKLMSFFRLAWPAKLSETDLKDRVQHYKLKLEASKED